MAKFTFYIGICCLMGAASFWITDYLPVQGLWTYLKSAFTSSSESYYFKAVPVEESPNYSLYLLVVGLAFLALSRFVKQPKK